MAIPDDQTFNFLNLIENILLELSWAVLRIFRFLDIVDVVSLHGCSSTDILKLIAVEAHSYYVVMAKTDLCGL